VDTPTAEHLIRLVSAHLQQSKSSAILVTHNLKEALQLADTIYFLSSKPTRIIKTFDVDPSDKNADHHARLILEKYPNILSGRVD
jgi:NitT/TauT family transport system ATP-binding protein